MTGLGVGDFKFENINGAYKISLYHKRDDLRDISRLIAFGRAYDDYTDFSLRHRALGDKLITQGYVKSRLKTKFYQFFEKYIKLISKYCKT